MYLSSFWANRANASARSSAESGPKPKPEPESVPPTIDVQKGIPKSDATAVTGDTSVSSDSLVAFLNTDSDEVLQDYFSESLFLSTATLEGIGELGIGQQELKDLVESSTDSMGRRFDEAMGEISVLKTMMESAKPEEFKRLEMQLAEKRALARKMAQEMRNMKKRHEEEKARMRAEKMKMAEEIYTLKAEIVVLTGKKPSRPTLANVPTNHPAPPAATEREEAAKRLFVDRHSEAAQQEAEEAKRANGHIFT